MGMFRTFNENFKSIRSAVQEKIAFPHFERSELMSERSDRAVVARFQMRAWSDDSVKIWARSVQPYRRSLRRRKKKEEETKAHQKPITTLRSALGAATGRFNNYCLKGILALSRRRKYSFFKVRTPGKVLMLESGQFSKVHLRILLQNIMKLLPRRKYGTKNRGLMRNVTLNKTTD